ncbi:MAG TPA: elongation factor G [Ruminococcaceae bacterium]|nr:elongation factor G [Oscillospiraceae bacterium]
MKQYSSKEIRNLVLLGHGGEGKTSLAEAILFLAGASERLGRVTDSNTVLDFDAEEKKRKISVSAALSPMEWKGTKLNIIDTPGLFDFAGGVVEGVRAASCAVIVLSGKSGVTVGAEKSYKICEQSGLPRFFFIGKLDSDTANYYKTLDALKEVYGSSVCPVVVPIMEGNLVKCYVNLLTGKAFVYSKGKPSPASISADDYAEYYDALCETVAGVDEALMEKYFSGEAFTAEELTAGLKAGAASGELIPVFGGAGLDPAAVDMLLDGVVDIFPSVFDCAPETGTLKDGAETSLKADENGSAAAIIFKTIADPFVGKLSYFKVASGKISSESGLINARTGAALRVSKVMYVKGGKQEDAPYITAGDIGAISKLADAKTGDTLCAATSPVTLKALEFPKPCLSMAVYAKAKGEEEKIAAGLIRLMEEDPTVNFETNHETREMILSGLGEQHLDVIITKLKTKFGVEVLLKVPKVAYRETIRKHVRVQGRHKKQSGGHGQFGDVWIEFEPCEGDELVFEEKVFGGSVPRNFFPAVEKGLRDSVKKGVLAGYPMVGLKAVLVDGSYHPVDSSEMSFKMAASLAYKAGIPQASPVLLEPIGTLTVHVPSDNMGDIMGEVNKRRGRVLGMNPGAEGLEEVVAEVPMAEVGDFATVIRSITQGRGSFSLEFARYEEAPPMVANKVVENAKSESED